MSVQANKNDTYKPKSDDDPYSQGVPSIFQEFDSYLDVTFLRTGVGAPGYPYDINFVYDDKVPTEFRHPLCDARSTVGPVMYWWTCCAGKGYIHKTDSPCPKFVPLMELYCDGLLSSYAGDHDYRRQFLGGTYVAAADHVELAGLIRCMAVRRPVLLLRDSSLGLFGGPGHKLVIFGSSINARTFQQQNPGVIIVTDYPKKRPAMYKYGTRIDAPNLGSRVFIINTHKIKKNKTMVPTQPHFLGIRHQI